MPSIFDPLINDPEDKAQNQALIGALRRQDALGALALGMGTKATMALGDNVTRGVQASFGEAMQARERAKQIKMQKEQLAQEAAQRQQAQANWQQNFTEQQRQFGAQEQRLADQQKRQFSAIGDPITGQSRIYNTFTGEWKDTAGGTPQAGAEGKPMGPTGYPKIPAGIKLPENASKNYIGSSMLAEHLPTLEGMISGGYSPTRTDLYAVGPPMGGGTGAAQGLTPRSLASDQGAQYYATGGKILTAILRPESGGAITGDEWNQYGPLYLPWPGDPPETIKSKMTNLREYMRRLAAGSGPASNFFVEPAMGAPGQNGRQPQRAGDKYLE